MLIEHFLSGDEAHQNKEAHQHGHGPAAGNSETQGGNEHAGINGIVRCLRSNHSANFPFAKGLPRSLFGFAGLGVSKPVGRRTPYTRQHADKQPDEGCPKDQPLVIQRIHDSRAPAAVHLPEHEVEALLRHRTVADNQV